MLDSLLVLEDVQSQLRSIESSVLYPLTYTSIPADHDFAGVSAIFGAGKAVPSLIIVDFKHFTAAQMQLLQEIRASKPHIPLIAMAAFGDDATRQALFNLGVSEVICKPIELDRFLHSIQTVLKIQRMSALIARLERQAEGVVRFEDIIGYSAPLRHVVSMGEHVAASRKHALIEGEAGSGKTLLARAIHGHSTASAPFIMLDCENLPEQKVEAYCRDKIAQAGAGTLYMREVGRLSQTLQQSVLDMLQKAEDGGQGFRLICANAMPLEPLIRKGTFHHGLYRFLRQVYIPMPSLNERREDIALLTQHFLAGHTARNNKFISSFSEDALRMLANAEWPGNVAQLSNLVWRCSMLCNQEEIDAGTLRLVQQMEPVHYAVQLQGVPGDMPSLVDAQGKIKKLRSIEDEAIRYALTHYSGSMTKAAASLGIGRSTLYRRMLGKDDKMDHMALANQATRPMMRVSSTDFS